MSNILIRNPNHTFSYLGNNKWIMFDSSTNSSMQIESNLYKLLCNFSCPMDHSSAVKLLCEKTLMTPDQCGKYIDLLVHNKFLCYYNADEYRQHGFFHAPFVTLDQLIMGKSRYPKIAFLGVPYDHGATVKSGSNEAPNFLRSSSNALFRYTPERNPEQYAYCPFAYSLWDLGNIKSGFGVEKSKRGLEYLTNIVTILCNSGVVPVIIGGDHSISYYTITGAVNSFEKIGVIQFDAHSDFAERKELGTLENLHHGNFMNWVMANDKVFDVKQIGIRDYGSTPIVDEKLAVWNDYSIMKNLNSFIDSLDCTLPYFVTFDVDVMAPNEIISTGTPLPGGLQYREVNYILKQIAQKVKIIGFDVVELIPGTSNEGIIINGIIMNLISSISQIKEIDGADYDIERDSKTT